MWAPATSKGRACGGGEHVWGASSAQVGAAFPQTRVPDLVFLVQFYNFTMFRLTFMLILAALGSFLTPTICILVYRNFSYRRDPSVLCFGSFKTECFHLDFSSKCLRSDLKSVDRGPPAQSPDVILSVALTEASAPGIPPEPRQPQCSVWVKLLRHVWV